MRTSLWKLGAAVAIGLTAPFAAIACNVFEPPPPEGLQGDGGTRFPDATVDVAPPEVEAASDVGTPPVTDAGGDAPPAADGGTIASAEASTSPWWPYVNTMIPSPEDAQAFVSCNSAGMPLATDRPDAAADSPDGGTTVYFGLSRLLVGTANDDATLTQNLNAWQSLGFDMDAVCTDSPTCLDPNDPTMTTLINQTSCQHNPVVIPQDGNDCIDNVLGSLYQISAQTQDVGQWFGLTEQDTNCELYRGGFGVILKVSRYNGQLNDDSVSVDFYNSTGLVNQRSWFCRAGNSMDGTLNPSWTTNAPWIATEHWRVTKSSISLAAQYSASDPDLPDSKWGDHNAYVRNGYLVAHMTDPTNFLPDSEGPAVNTSLPSFLNVMHQGVIVAQIHVLTTGQFVGQWALDNGTMAWITNPGELMQSFQYMGYCTNMCADYTTVQDYLNSHMDMLSGLTRGMLEPQTPCDSISVGFGFHAQEATALPADIFQDTQPVNCPEPPNSSAPRQNCSCDAGPCDPNACFRSDAGCSAPEDAGATEAGATDAGPADAGPTDAGKAADVGAGG